ncbi:hypothetical protein AVEN_167598-1 [Araneus ventricosus]|uniref:Uncharacterized protein n=1 Tax=Araneus ventricosus TaxID=182803 RepID=A0A4Y2HT74_ARAVE|nr:hypothetical protein AVEN_167598-1 [Araneus ventricosus]
MVFAPVNSTKPNQTRQNIIFATDHDPFPSYFKRLRIRESVVVDDDPRISAELYQVQTGLKNLIAVAAESGRSTPLRHQLPIYRFFSPQTDSGPRNSLVK